MLLLGVWLEHAWMAQWRLPAAGLLFLSIVSLALVLRVGPRIPDAITLLRAFALLPLMAVPFASPWIFWILAVLVSLLDLVDGALARRLGATTAGAVLDMETDQLTVATFALLLVAAGGAPHVLLLPMMRPAFVLAAWRYGLPATDPKPVDGDNRRGKRVCAAVMVALLLGLMPGVAAWLRDVATGIAVLLLLWSFSSDWQFLRQQRRAAKEPHGSH
ncbi:MAG: phosphatidylglycerophosphate synthase [Hyphomicrobiaceae bacterium]|jgi:phosphatidylglycerophosphate synthase